jgi:hypothetical protein
LSTALDIDFDIDLSLLVGPMDEIGCEHSAHDTQPQFHSDGPATHYIHIKHECGNDVVYAACARWVDIVRNRALTYRCAKCRVRLGREHDPKILGPVANV